MLVGVSIVAWVKKYTPGWVGVFVTLAKAQPVSSFSGKPSQKVVRNAFPHGRHESRLDDVRQRVPMKRGDMVDQLMFRRPLLDGGLSQRRFGGESA